MVKASSDGKIQPTTKTKTTFTDAEYTENTNNINQPAHRYVRHHKPDHGGKLLPLDGKWAEKAECSPNITLPCLKPHIQLYVAMSSVTVRQAMNHLIWTAQALCLRLLVLTKRQHHREDQKGSDSRKCRKSSLLWQLTVISLVVGPSHTCFNSRLPLNDG